MKKILMFATYTIANPQHGGQKRVRAIYDAYKKIGYDVNFCAIYFPSHYKDSWKGDLSIPAKYSMLLAQNPLTGDVITGSLLKKDKKLNKEVKRKILEFNPDIIEIEHPFLYIGLESILNETSFKGKIIYSSHNIEYSMKQEMLENENYPEQQIIDVVDEIKTAEVKLTSRADLLFAVSEGDAKVLVAIGADSDKVILARNGIEKQEVDTKEVQYWNEFFSRQNVTKIALFVGSAHPPNWTGFEKMIGSKIGFLGPNERIILAGSIGEYFLNNYKHGTVRDTVFWKRIIATGRLSEPRLVGLIGRADCLILPIVEGGGSNLKTAEAILSGKSIVGTTHAFRAFEAYLKYPNIHVTDEPKKFREMIGSVLRSDAPALSDGQTELLNDVTWDVCLRGAIGRVMKL